MLIVVVKILECILSICIAKNIKHQKLEKTIKTKNKSKSLQKLDLTNAISRGVHYIFATHEKIIMTRTNSICIKNAMRYNYNEIAKEIPWLCRPS